MSTASPRLLSRSKVVIDRVHLVDIRCGCIFVGLCETHSWPAWRTAQAGISSLKISRGSGRGGGSRVEGWRDSCGPRCDITGMPEKVIRPWHLVDNGFCRR